MPDPLPWILQAVVALTFAWAAAAKLIRWSTWTSSLAAYGVPQGLRAPLAVLVPALEVAVPALMVAGETKSAMAVAIALLSGFSLAVLVARARTGDRLPCGCFGGTEERDYRLMLIRNSLLGGLAGLVLVAGPEDGFVTSGDAPPARELVPVLLVAVGVLLLVWMLRHATSLMRRREHM